MKLIDFIFPPRCPLCGTVTTEKDKTFPLCENCFDLQEKEKFDKITDVADYLPQNKDFYCAFKYNGFLRKAVLCGKGFLRYMARRKPRLLFHPDSGNFPG